MQIPAGLTWMQDVPAAAAWLDALAAIVEDVSDRWGLEVGALLTAGLGFCPLYSIIGLNTCPIKK